MNQQELSVLEALLTGNTDTVKPSRTSKKALNKLKKYEQQEETIEIKFKIIDEWSRRLFIAVCKKYGIEPYRYERQQENILMLKAPKSFAYDVLWPEYDEINDELKQHLWAVTEQVISECLK